MQESHISLVDDNDDDDEDLLRDDFEIMNEKF